MSRSRAPLLAAALATFTALTACGDSGSDPSEPEPGTLELQITSPAGSEGAALVEVTGVGVQGVQSAAGRAFMETMGVDTTQVLLILDTPGLLVFEADVADINASVGGRVLDVAGPDNALRADPAAYTVRVVR